MRAKGRKRSAVAGMARIAVLAGSTVLGACATDHSRWMDSATLVLRPSHKQALLSYSFGSDAPRQDVMANAGRSVAASIAAASEVHNDFLPRMDNMDFKGGRFYIHSSKQQ